MAGLTGLLGPMVRPATLLRQRSQTAPTASARTYPSAAASSVLQRPSGASMPAHANLSRPRSAAGRGEHASRQACLCARPDHCLDNQLISGKRLQEGLPATENMA